MAVARFPHTSTAAAPVPEAPNGGQSGGKVAPKALAAQGPAHRPRDKASLPFGRLLGLEAAGRYLGVSPWLVSQWILDGSLPVVELPRPKTASAWRWGARRPIGDTLRKVLLDPADLDAFVAERARKVRR